MGLGNIMRDPFYPRLFFGRSKNLPPFVGALSKSPVNKYGSGLQNPVTSAKDKHKSSLRARFKKIGAVTGGRAFKPLTTFGRLKGSGGKGKILKCCE